MIYNRPEYWLAKTETVVPYLTFSSQNSFTLGVEDAMQHWDGILEYSTDKVMWDLWDGAATLSSAIAINGSDNVLYLRGSGNTMITGGGSNCKWFITGSDVKCIGNIENLLDYNLVACGVHPTMVDGCYDSMFQDCTALIQAPTLPATTLTNYCYQYMFCGCTSLTQAPALPSTTLTDSCYSSMFQDCTALIQAPTLPATTLTNYCYQYMFCGCTSLKLSATQTGEYTVAYRIPTTGTGRTAKSALSNMFTNTGGTFTGTPEINTTYYLSNTNTVV